MFSAITEAFTTVSKATQPNFFPQSHKSLRSGKYGTDYQIQSPHYTDEKTSSGRGHDLPKFTQLTCGWELRMSKLSIHCCFSSPPFDNILPHQRMWLLIAIKHLVQKCIFII